MDMEYDEFFQRRGDHFVRTIFYESQDGIAIEELYQQFKARFIHEMEETNGQET